MSYQLSQWAALVAVPSVYEKAVLLVLAQSANSETAQTWIGQETVAERARVSVRKVVEVMATLEGLGLLKRSRRFLNNGNRTSDLITLSPSAPCACGEPENTAPSAHGAGGPSARHVIDQVHAVQGNPKVNPKIDNMSSGSPSSERKVKAKADYPEAFNSLWKAYPHYPGRSDKRKSVQAWERLTIGDQAALSTAVDAFRSAPQATKDGGQFVKAFHLWIGNDLWRDFIPSAPVVEAPEVVDWEARVATFKNTGAWPARWGEKPGRDGCIVPADVLKGHGYAKADPPSLKVINGGAA